MAMSLNVVHLAGNLGRDPEIRQSQNGAKFASLSLATNKKWKDRNTGERKEHTEWHKVDVIQQGDSGLVTNVIEPYLKKGDSIYIIGELRTDKFQDQAGNDRFMTKIAVAGPQHQLILNSERRQGEAQGQAPAQAQPDNRGASPGAGMSDDLDDEIPFAPIRDLP